MDKSRNVCVAHRRERERRAAHPTILNPHLSLTKGEREGGHHQPVNKTDAGGKVAVCPRRVFIFAIAANAIADSLELSAAT